MVSENRMLMGVSGCKGEDVTGAWRKIIKMSFIIFTAYEILLG
jgi:hypothetical protein